LYAELYPDPRQAYSPPRPASVSISPGGQQMVFERAVYPFDMASGVWMMKRDGWQGNETSSK
jgi:hypothetical protein